MATYGGRFTLTPVYLHMGHLIDKGGYLRFKERVLRDVQLNPEAMVAERIYWAEDG
ncbi:anaerobic sulfite reductase subunit C [Escherichia coli]|nr:anaerobic sulfite reductase subunit C [Escherichia coli]